jgi:beta-lactam-binding protein with PASTA domain
LKTYREAVPTLKALGLEEGTITYVPNRKTWFWRCYKGRNIKPGDKVLKSSKIDLVLGDGKMSYEEEIGTDSIANPTEEMPNEQ